MSCRCLGWKGEEFGLAEGKRGKGKHWVIIQRGKKIINHFSNFRHNYLESFPSLWADKELHFVLFLQLSERREWELQQESRKLGWKLWWSQDWAGQACSEPGLPRHTAHSSSHINWACGRAVFLYRSTPTLPEKQLLMLPVSNSLSTKPPRPILKWEGSRFSLLLCFIVVLSCSQECFPMLVFSSTAVEIKLQNIWWFPHNILLLLK